MLIIRYVEQLEIKADQFHVGWNRVQEIIHTIWFDT